MTSPLSRQAYALAGLAVLLAIGPANARPWTIDRGASEIRFETTALGAPVEGVFGEWFATITFDASNLAAAQAIVLIDLTSVDTQDATRDETLRGPDWFDTGAHPQARLVSTAFHEADGGGFVMDANLTIRGQARGIRLPFTLTETGDGDAVRAQGMVTIDRTAFGVGQGEFVGDSTVALEVTISIDISASIDT